MSESIKHPSHSERPGASVRAGLRSMERLIGNMGLQAVAFERQSLPSLQATLRRADVAARWLFPAAGWPAEQTTVFTQRGRALATGLRLGILAGHHAMPTAVEDHYLDTLVRDLHPENGYFRHELCTDAVEATIDRRLLSYDFVAELPAYGRTGVEDMYHLGTAFIAQRTDEYQALIERFGVRSLGRSVSARRALKRDARQLSQRAPITTADLPLDMRPF